MLCFSNSNDRPSISVDVDRETFKTTDRIFKLSFVSKEWMQCSIGISIQVPGVQHLVYLAVS